MEAPPLSAKEGGVIRRGYDAALDELLRHHFHQQQRLDRPFPRPTRSSCTGINSLKVGYNQVHGYYIEITHTHGDRIPDNYELRQTLKNAERYVTPELKEY